jgi:hypothetical protein
MYCAVEMVPLQVFITRHITIALNLRYFMLVSMTPLPFSYFLNVCLLHLKQLFGQRTSLITIYLILFSAFKGFGLVLEWNIGLF